MRQGVHPARLKAQLRAMLAIDRTLTTVQLERRGLLKATEWLDLPQICRTCRTRTTQSHSTVDLTFVALNPRTLARSARDLMHDAGLAEARHRVHHGLHPNAIWQHVDVAGRKRTHLPDAEVLNLHSRRLQDFAVEFDAGYAPARVEQKLKAAAEAGYSLIIWATSIHARTSTVAAQARKLHGLGQLLGVDDVVTLFVDFWTLGDPYARRTRCYKKTLVKVRFKEQAG